ncbi:MAG TPA: hypothetical protein VE077_15330 [Candidatus Methylomirabilis sp.]|nr:hypothetical protein [Candidatus Methylomirabilis sp.]
MNEIKTEPLATPTEIAEAPQPTESANPPEANPTEQNEPSLPAPDLSAPTPAAPRLTAATVTAAAANIVATVRKSPGKFLLYAAVVVFGLVALDFLAQIPRWRKETRVRQVQRAVNTVTPDSLLTRCGQPLNDVTEDLYPMIARKITYNSAPSAQTGPQKVVLFFTRTAEEKSDWVYTSMKDETGVTSYSTPEEQAVALPCLASTK